MEPLGLQSLVPLINRRFSSFADATDAILTALAVVLPGSVALGQRDPEEGICRVLQVRGEPQDGIVRGALLPLAGRGNASDVLDRERLRPLGIEASLSLPLELGNGSWGGLVCALAPEQGAYRAEHVIILGLAARILSYEWEGTSARAELRRLRQSVHDGERVDLETGLANRASFMELLEREWRLARRGTVRSMAIICHVRLEGRRQAAPMHSLLALKDAADVLAAAIRSTDHIGRVGKMTLGVVMIGADADSGDDALIQRYLESLRQATGVRPLEIAVSCGAYALAEANSPEEALAQAEHAARESARVERTGH